VRLLVVTQYFWPENFRINDLVEGLVSRGHQVTVLTGKPNYPDGKVFTDFLANPDAFHLYKGAQIIRVPMLVRGRGNLQLMLNYLLFALSASVIGPWRLRGQKFDAIFAYEPSPITVGIPAALLRAVKGAPLAFWVLDLWPDSLEAIGVVRSKIVLSLVGKLVSAIYKRCDLILAQSRSFIPKITQYAGNSARVEYFPSWAESTLNITNVKPAPEVPLKDGAFDVLFAGNIGDAQDFPAILAAAELLKGYPDIRWLVVGDGRKAGWVADQIQLRGLQSNVLLLGHYAIDRMPSFFMHADALLVSLRDEPIFALTIPGKLQAYLVTGKPILAMLNGEGADIVERGQVGLCCQAGDYQSLAKAVLRVYQMPVEDRQAMGTNGIKLSDKEFSRDHLIGQLESWLGSLNIKCVR
jgi:glycosyltransferase involved in cell wall biosynthesis